VTIECSWSDHACRACMGRLLRRHDEATGRTTYECGGCGQTAKGSPEPICGCGVLPRPATGAAPTGPRFRCVPNPARGVASPSVIVIAFGEQPA
jgi:hypothetical protein